MNLIRPAALPYDPLEWEARPFTDRARLACQAWAIQGYGAPFAAYVFYALKLAFYLGGWLFFCSLTPRLGGLGTLADWWLAPVAFQKAILWSMLFEGLGLGCGSGPLAGHHAPPIGGVLYFARPRTLRLPVFPRLPLLGGDERTWFDVWLYLLVVACLVRALLAPGIGLYQLAPIALLLPLLGLRDRTVFLCFRAEHYWVTVLCFALAGNWIPGAKSVQLALWFWAGVSKLNHHFPAVVCVMTSNSPFLRWRWLRTRMYRAYPDDLRPSRLARSAARFGTLLEFAVPAVLAFARSGPELVLGLTLMLLLHGFITSNVPLGVPIEWNFMVVYGGFALFWAHPEIPAFAIDRTSLGVVLVATLICVPLLGNLFPRWVSFLLSMRYYAGNWAMSVWLFRGQSAEKLDRLHKSAERGEVQLARSYDHATVVGLSSRTLAFRMMHLHGRALPELLPRAVERIEDYQYVEGELVAAVALGWNFGDGHLHGPQLLRAIQAQCGFEPGELRVLCVESQPLGRGTLDYEIFDAATGLCESGRLEIARLRERQPWATQPLARIG